MKMIPFADEPNWRDKPNPAWFRFAHRWLWRIPHLIGLANEIYVSRHGFYPPSLLDVLESSTLHALSPNAGPRWSEGHDGR